MLTKHIESGKNSKGEINIQRLRTRQWIKIKKIILIFNWENTWLVDQISLLDHMNYLGNTLSIVMWKKKLNTDILLRLSMESAKHLRGQADE